MKVSTSFYTTRVLVPAALALGLAYISHAQDDKSVRHLSLKEAVNFALKNQPDLASAAAQATAADQRHVQARAKNWPSLSANFSANDSSNTLFSSSSGGSAGTTVNSERQADLILAYKLMDSGQRRATERRTEAGRLAALYSAESQRQATIANAVTAYFELLRLTELVKVQESSVMRSLATLQLTTARVEIGKQARKDIYQAQADYESEKVNLIGAKNNASFASAQLKQALGLNDDLELEVSEPAEFLTWADTKSLSSLVKDAFLTRPDVLRAIQNVEESRASLRLVKANNGLNLDVSANLTSVFSQDRYSRREFALNLSLPLFDGGASRAAIKEAEASLTSAESLAESARISARVDVESSYRTFQASKAAVPAARTAHEAAQTNFEVASFSLKEGVGTVVEVITAQSLLVKAQTNYVQAIYSVYTSDVALRRSLGKANEFIEVNS